MATNNDQDLVLRLQMNDKSAFESLYCTYHKAIYRNALKVTKDEQASLDILQEVFSVLWEKRQSINPLQPVSGWLFVISFNKAINHLRHQARENEAFSKIALLPAGDDEESFKLYQHQYLLLHQAIEQLPLQRQKVFTLCKLEGKSYEETARILKISKHTVKEYLSLGMASVKDYVKAHPNDWETTSIGLFILHSYIN